MFLYICIVFYNVSGENNDNLYLWWPVLLSENHKNSYKKIYINTIENLLHPFNQFWSKGRQLNSYINWFVSLYQQCDIFCCWFFLPRQSREFDYDTIVTFSEQRLFYRLLYLPRRKEVSCIVLSHTKIGLLPVYQNIILIILKLA